MREILMHLVIIYVFEIDQNPKRKFDNHVKTYDEQFMSPFSMDTKNKGYMLTELFHISVDYFCIIILQTRIMYFILFTISIFRLMKPELNISKWTHAHGYLS